jgi:16S rRNA processing protein RimM
VTEAWIVVGEITAPQGIQGEVRVFPATDFPERLQTLTKCHVRKNGNMRSYTVESARPHKGFFLFKLGGVDNRDDALELKASEIVVPRSEVAPLPEGRHYIFDLIGMKAETIAGDPIGIVKDVLTGSGNDVFVIKRVGKTDALVPAVHEFITCLDVTARLMVINPWPGLLDDTEGDGQE